MSTRKTHTEVHMHLASSKMPTCHGRMQYSKKCMEAGQFREEPPGRPHVVSREGSWTPTAETEDGWRDGYSSRWPHPNMSMGHCSSALACVPSMSRSQYDAWLCHFAQEWPNRRFHSEYHDRQKMTPDLHSQSHEHYQTKNAEYPNQTETKMMNGRCNLGLRGQQNRSRCTDWPHPWISENSDVPSSWPAVLDLTHHYEHDIMGSMNETKMDETKHDGV